MKHEDDVKTDETPEAAEAVTDATGSESNEPDNQPEPASLTPEEALRVAEDRNLRLLAEFDNFRRRSTRDREQAVENGVADFVRPLLDVLDNLERALEHAGGDGGPLADGVSLTVRQFQDSLKTAGVEPVDPAGEAFDPRFHEAIQTQPSDAIGVDHVVTVVSRGYRLGERVLRPAVVIVSSGPADA